MRAVLIDLDGTLLDTIGELADAANAMLAELGRPRLPQDAVRSYVGKGIPNLVGRCLSQDVEASREEVDAALPVFQRHYAAVNGRHASIFPGAREGLERMRGLGLSLGCITNKAQAFTEPLLRQLALRDYFGVVVSGDTLPEKKPHPLPLLYACQRLGVAPGDTLFVGDAANDVQAARAAGCRGFCVPYGYREGRDVHELGADAIVSTLEEAADRLPSHK